MNKAKIAGVSAIALVSAVTILDGYFTVAEYERIVVTRNGAYDYIAAPGLHFKLPFMDSTRVYRIDTQQFTTGKLNTYTIDNQEVDATLTVQWRIPANDVEYTFANNPEPRDKLASMVIDRFKVEGGRINVTEFANNRGALVKAVYDKVKGEAARLYHLEVLDVQLTNLDYQDSFRNAQAQAAVVKTQIEQAQGLKLKAVIDAEQVAATAAGQANAQIEAARGRATALKLESEAQAAATLIKGKAEASAQELMAESLSKNGALVEYKKALQWDGKLPVNIYAGAPIPFLNVK